MVRPRGLLPGAVLPSHPKPLHRRFAGGGVNLYAYVGNDDSLGLYFGIDDLIFTLGGAAVGLGGQVAGDLFSSWRAGSWQFSGWEDYAGSAIGGAAGGEALLYTGPVGAGLVGGAIGNLSKQLAEEPIGAAMRFLFRKLRL